MSGLLANKMATTRRMATLEPRQRLRIKNRARPSPDDQDRRVAAKMPESAAFLGVLILSEASPFPAVRGLLAERESLFLIYIISMSLRAYSVGLTAVGGFPPRRLQRRALGGPWTGSMVSSSGLPRSLEE